jgi:uncharacterized protein (TIGR02301 family)
MFRTLTAACIALCVVAGTAQAQFGSPYAPWQPQPPPPRQPQFRRPAAPKAAQPAPQTQASAPAVQDQPAPYDRDLQRLSEILGALHFLRGICGSNEGQKWRDEAQALIDTEAPGGQRHEAMVASFNRGYRGFQQSYRSCTPAAGMVIRRYLEEGAGIARDITARYAN